MKTEIKYVFKEIKDVDLSKLDVSKMYYTIDKNGDNRLSSTYWLLDGDFTYILMPCSPIVETDKLREEFEEFFDGISVEGYCSSANHSSIFNFLLPHLSVSKEVEVSDEEIEKLFNKFRLESSLMSFVMSKESFKRGFEECAKLLMRDKQGIAPKEVEEKCVEVIENKSVNPDVLKEGTVLIAINECFMNFTKEKALIIGKEYKVKGFYSGKIMVESAINTNHYFDLANYTDYFKLKEGETK